MSSGGSSSCNERLEGWHKPRSSFRRCKKEQASIWKPSRSKSRKPCSRTLASKEAGGVTQSARPLTHPQTFLEVDRDGRLLLQRLNVRSGEICLRIGAMPTNESLLAASRTGLSSVGRPRVAAPPPG